MALRRYTNAVDGSIPISALLYDDEELLTSQADVGIYEGSLKSPPHQSGTVHLTSHRLFFVPVSYRQYADAFSLKLVNVSQTDYYAGLLRSSAKITLHLASTSSGASNNHVDQQADQADKDEIWECEVCGNKNAPGSNFAAKTVCQLCGVPRDAISSIAPPLPAPPPPPPPVEVALDSIACPACTFSNPLTRQSCEICGTALPSSAGPSRPGSVPPPDEVLGAEASRIKLSFRKGGSHVFYTALKRSLKGKAWEGKVIGKKSQNNADVLQYAGIDSIMRNAATNAQNTELDMTDALRDIEHLSIKARDMLNLAKELNERLSAQSNTTSTEPEEATFIRSSLSQLGLQMTNAPVTLDMMRDEKKWVEELARELAKVLQGSNNGGIMKDRGIVALDEIWGSWNRARGVALIPPSTFMQVLGQLPHWTLPPLQTRKFPSGLRVLHTPAYTPTAFSERLLTRLSFEGPRTTVTVAQEEGMTIGLTTEMLAEVEAKGAICRDDPDGSQGNGIGGVQLTWWTNVLSTYEWDGD